MEEKVESQHEVLKYPVKIYVEAAAIWIAGLLCLGILLKTGTLSIFGILDVRKCAAAIAVFGMVETGCFLFLFRKENRCAVIQEDVDYIEWEDEYDEEYDDELPIPNINEFTSPEETREGFYQEEFLKQTGNNFYDNSFRDGTNSSFPDDTKTQQLDEEEGEETELLVDFQNRSIAYLESEFSGERIYLEKFPFIIGKLKNGDYVLESPKISRVHARFDYDDGCYYIEDMGSTNGTHINGEQLYAHERKPVPDRARISLADINFLFHC
jgi:hypothetical protein